MRHMRRVVDCVQYMARMLRRELKTSIPYTLCTSHSGNRRFDPRFSMVESTIPSRFRFTRLYGELLACPCGISCHYELRNSRINTYYAHYNFTLWTSPIWFTVTKKRSTYWYTVVLHCSVLANAVLIDTTVATVVANKNRWKHPDTTDPTPLLRCTSNSGIK